MDPWSLIIGTAIKEGSDISQNGFNDWAKRKNWIWDFNGDNDYFGKDWWKYPVQNMDPGMIFFDVTGNKTKTEKEAQKIAGKTQEEWVDELGISDKELQDYFSQLSRQIATQGAQARNRADDISARNNLPAATQLAAERGVQVNQMEATEKGMTALERMQAEANRRANEIVLQMFGSKEMNTEAFARAQQAATQQQMNQMFAQLGEMAAEKYFGSGNDYYVGNGQFVTDAPGSTYEPYTYW